MTHVELQQARDKKQRQSRSAKGMITMADDFDESLQDFEEYT